MRLLDAKKLEVVDVSDDSVPEYAALSHTWGPKEVSFQDLQRLSSDSLRFYLEDHPIFTKITRAASLAVRNGYSYIWIDTCCIDKTSSAELSEAINSMYRWYEQAAVCYVYLADVAPFTEENDHEALERSNFRLSRWFTRGWTLQELIAPKDVRFYAQDWSYIGSHKEEFSFRNLLSNITGVDDRVLEGSLSPQDLSVSTRMKWAALRQTTRTEDIAYSLMGLFGVNMPLLYGEGRRAFVRLQEEILKETDDQSLFAWTTQRTEGQAEESLSGLLAESPLAFKDVGNVRPLPPLLTRDSVPSSITNQGLRIQLYLAPVSTQDQNSVEEEYHAILDCSLREGIREYCPTIYLRRLWGDQFARVRSRECVLQPPPADDVFTRNKGYQTVYVKQRPVYIIPEFTLPTGNIPLPANISEGEAYTLRGVHPPERWHSNSMTLKSVYSQLNRVMGVFRFSHPLKPDMQVDVAVGLQRLNQKRWESWCLQRRCRGDSLDLVFQHFDQMLRNTSRRISYIKSSDFDQLSLEQDDLIQSVANVIETQMHGRSYITLYVFGRPEIYTSRELKSLSDARVIMPNPFGISHSSAVYPSTVAAEISLDLEDEICTLTMACSVEDAVELSIFPTSPKTTRVRRSPQGSELTSSCMEVFRDLLSSIAPDQLRPKNPISGNLSPSMRKWSTDLLYACKDGNTAQVGILIRMKEVIEGALIEIETENFQSFRPLHWATIGGHLPVIQLLLSVGAQEYPRTAQDMTPIHLAAMMGHLGVMIYFFEKATHTGVSIDSLLDVKISGTLETAYHLAAAYLSPESAEYFLNALHAYGEDRLPVLCSTNYLDETPLHRAAAMGNAEAVRCLLKLKPKFYRKQALHEVDKFGRTAVWHAACGGSAESIRALAIHGAMIDLADDYARTPLVAACREGRTDAVGALLQLGANPNIAARPLA